MTLEKLQSEMIQAMKNGDKFRKAVVADMIGNIYQVELSECKGFYYIGKIVNQM